MEGWSFDEKREDLVAYAYTWLIQVYGGPVTWRDRGSMERITRHTSRTVDRAEIV